MWGGSRPNSGRKKLPVPRKCVTFRLNAEEEQIVKEFVQALKKKTNESQKKK